MVLNSLNIIAPSEGAPLHGDGWEEFCLPQPRILLISVDFDQPLRNTAPPTSLKVFVVYERPPSISRGIFGKKRSICIFHTGTRFSKRSIFGCFQKLREICLLRNSYMTPKDIN